MKGRENHLKASILKVGGVEMRLEVATYSFGEYDFLEELVERYSYIYVWIYCNGKPLLNGEGKHLKRVFDQKEHSLHIRNFCRKFAEDEEYRKKFILEYEWDPFEGKDN